MIDLTTIDQDTIIARGQYSSVNAAHKDALKKLAILCGEFSSITPQVLRQMQPEGDALPDSEYVRGLLGQGRRLIDKIDTCAAEIAGLAAQKAALKPVAWGGQR